MPRILLMKMKIYIIFVSVWKTVYKRDYYLVWTVSDILRHPMHGTGWNMLLRRIIGNVINFFISGFFPSFIISGNIYYIILIFLAPTTHFLCWWNR